jgi:uncharacterized protein YndB with AHSA1/START domain
MIDIEAQIDAVHRQTGTRPVGDREAKTVLLRRDYAAQVTDVWDALTDGERISRWFLPVTGDLKLGGHYQLKGNAGGEIVACEPPRLLRVTWVMGEQAEGDLSEVEVRLTPDGDRTRFELEHAATVPPEFWDQFGPGAVGVGWDGALLGLALHLETGEGVSDPDAWSASEEGRSFFTRSAEAWGDAHEAAGASSEDAAAATAATTSFYAPPQES